MNKALGVKCISRVFRTEMMKGSRGLFGLALVGFLLKLNVLENYVGTWERLNT
jgi:hypothetical protein